MIMKGCVQWNSVYGWEDFTSSEDPTLSARSVGQLLTHWANGAPIYVEIFPTIYEVQMHTAFHYHQILY